MGILTWLFIKIVQIIFFGGIAAVIWSAATAPTDKDNWGKKYP